MLSFGQPATVPFEYDTTRGTQQAVITFSNLALTEGKAEDWATIGVAADDAHGALPWYLQVTIKQEAGGNLESTSPESRLVTVTAGDDRIAATFGTNSDDNPVCQTDYAPTGFAVGQSYQTCVVIPVPEGQRLASVRYELATYSESDPYYDNPVVWQ